MSDHIDATAEEISTELVPAQAPAPATLFRTDDPLEVVEKATRVANALKGVLVAQGMVQNISGKEHVKVEGWTTLGAMLGVVPVVSWSRPIAGTDRPFEREEGYGDKKHTVKGRGSSWEARVEARTLDGRVIGAAEAMCSRDEHRWKDADDYAVKSMAQTRATSKALASPLRFIVTLAGFEGTPAEEMDGVTRTHHQDSGPSEKQLDYLKTLLKRKRPANAQVEALLPGVTVEDGYAAKLTKAQASTLIEALKEGTLPVVEAAETPVTDAPADLREFEHPRTGPMEELA